MNMRNVLLGKFQQCFGTFIMLLVEGSYETGSFRHLSHYVFGFRNFEIPKSITAIFFFVQHVQDFHVVLKYGAKN